MNCLPLNIICVLLFVITCTTNIVQGEHTETHTCQKYKELSGDCGGNDIKWIRDASRAECISKCNENANCAGFTYVHGNVDSRVGSNGCCLKSKSCDTPVGNCDPSREHCFHTKPKDCETENTGYFLGEYRKSFEDAKQYCEEKGSTLAIIKNEHSQREAAEICGKYTCWIGLVEHGDQDGTWKWLDGETLSYDNWAQGEPNNYNGRDEKNAMMNCCGEEAEIFSDGQWVDVKKEDDVARPLCGLGGDGDHDGGVGGIIALIFFLMVCVGVITCACWRRRKISNNTNQQQATVIGVASNNANQRQGNVIGVTSSPHAVQQIQMVPQQGVQKVTIVQPNGQPRQLMQMQNGAQPIQFVQGGVMQNGAQPIQFVQGGVMQNGAQPIQFVQGGVMQNGAQPIQFVQGGVMQNGAQPIQFVQGGVMQNGAQPIQFVQGGVMQNGAQPTQLVQGGVSQPTQGQGYVIQQPGRNNFNNQPSTMTYQGSVAPLAPPPVVVQATRIHTNAVNRQNI
eukprot:g203.t1